MLKRFENFGNLLGLMKKYHVWQTSSNPVFLDMKRTDTLVENISFIHENPVRDRFVDTATDYPYSSARDYAGMKGLVKITKIPAVEQLLGSFGKFQQQLLCEVYPQLTQCGLAFPMYRVNTTSKVLIPAIDDKSN